MATNNEPGHVPRPWQNRNGLAWTFLNREINTQKHTARQTMRGRRPSIRLNNNFTAQQVQGAGPDGFSEKLYNLRFSDWFLVLLLLLAAAHYVASPRCVTLQRGAAAVQENRGVRLRSDGGGERACDEGAL
jgi:hypothetical protein